MSPKDDLDLSELCILIPGFGPCRSDAEKQAGRLHELFPRAQVIVSDGANVAAARNAALRSASGKWVLWVDSDDELLIGADDVLAAMSGEADVTVWDYESYWPEGGFREATRWGRKAPSADDYARDVLADSRLSSVLWGRLWKRQVFEGLRFDERLTELEDYALMPQILPRIRRVAAVNRVGYRYVRHGGSLTTSLSLEKLLRGIELAKARAAAVPPKWRRAAEIGAAQMSSCILVRRAYKNEFIPETAFRTALRYIQRRIPILLLSSHVTAAWKARYLIHALCLWRFRQFFR